MIVSDEAKVLFIHLPRVGGTSISNALLKNLPGAKNLGEQHDNALTLPDSFWLKYQDYFVFAFARNSWGRIYSWYCLLQEVGQSSKVAPFASFDEFLKVFSDENRRTDISSQFHFNQIDCLLNRSGKLVVNKICQYENYEEEIRGIFREIGCTLNELERLNLGTVGHYSSNYSSWGRDVVGKLCARDIATFGYVFEEV